MVISFVMALFMMIAQQEIKFKFKKEFKFEGLAALQQKKEGEDIIANPL